MQRIEAIHKRRHSICIKRARAPASVHGVCTLGLRSPHPRRVSHKYSNLSLWRAVPHNKKQKPKASERILGNCVKWIYHFAKGVGADVILIIYTEATGESTCLCIQTDVSKFISRCEHTRTSLLSIYLLG